MVFSDVCSSSSENYIAEETCFFLAATRLSRQDKWQLKFKTAPFFIKHSQSWTCFKLPT